MFPESVDLHYPLLNHVVRERLDPVFGALYGGCGPRCYLAIELLVMFIGVMLLVRREAAGRTGHVKALLFSLITLCLMLVATPLDPFFLNVYWYPWLLLALDYRAARRSKPALVLVCAAGALWICAAGAAAFLGIVLAFIYLQLRLQQERSCDLNRSELILLTAGCAASIASIPVYPMPAYPWGARLADISAFVFSPEPYFSPSLIPDPLRYDQYLALLSAYSIRLVFCLTILALAASSARRAGNGRWGWFLLSLLVIPSDQLLFPLVGEASPYRFLRNLIPGVAIFALPWKLIPLMLVLCAAATDRLPSVRRLGVLLCITIGALAADASWGVFPGPPSLSGQPTAVGASPSNPPNLAASPSALVFAIYRDFFGNHRPNESALVQLRPGEDYSIQPQSEVSAGEAAAAADGSLQTRWATRRPQSPGDSLTVSFDRPLLLSAVRLALGQSGSDFPRGIAVEVRFTETEPFRRIVSMPHWFGPLQLAPSGYPYFGPQSDVLLWFPAAERCTAVRFVQLSADPFFDWSIAEVELFGPK